MIWILKENLGDMDHPRVKRRRNDKPHIYGLHVFPLHAMGAENERRLLWESGRDMGA